MKEGRPRNEGTMTREELAIIIESSGGVRGVAAKAGCSISALYKFMNGKRGMPIDLERRIRHLQGKLGD
jgi:hypothetical protein